MQTAVAAAFGSTGLHIGDVAWLSRQFTHRQLREHIRMWERGDDVFAWTYWRDNGGFNAFMAPGHGDEALADELVETVRRDAAAANGPSTFYTYAVDVERSPEDRALREVLLRRGFAPERGPAEVLIRDLGDLPDVVLPAGYRLDAVQTARDVAGRVSAHQDAFGSADLTRVKYARIRRRWPHRAELDRTALAPDGAVAAFCTAWLDEANACALMEPVGTRADHRRRGLAAAVCLDALHLARAAGARRAIVGYSSEPARALYTSLGFRFWARDTQYRQP
jgi:GNAT superfamily N-acetyltransferase